ncbi:MAG TPA: radical SAM protein [Syntrophorhabdaceae bacterium]|nr:radical SAM protein [Syntrophorhabdaceae bacterium]
MAKYVFGPVPSRRLGFSLGVDVVPYKHCPFDCIYCQIGKTTCIETERHEFVDPHLVLDEIAEKIRTAERIDHISFSGSGEPTLNRNIGMMIREVKRITSIPVAVITNGALLNNEDVRKDLMSSDVVLPSLDAASEDVFRFINKPDESIDLESVINGLKLFRKEYNGKIWLEIMLIKNVNDGAEELKNFKKLLPEIQADKIQLNTVERPPSDGTAAKLNSAEMEHIREYLGGESEIICGFEKTVAQVQSEDWSAKILEILQRRSLTLEDIVRITGISSKKARNRLKLLENRGLIKSYIFHDDVFYMRTD